jgi:DNA-binding NtrC family response regulator
VRGSNLSVFDRCSGLRMPNVWQVIHSVFNGSTPRRKASQAGIPIVALVVSDLDRHVLASLSGQELLEVHFVESCEEAFTLANQLTAPVILVDRDLPGTEWRIAVKSLAASPHRACVILMSGVADDYLRQELNRRGGYDVLPKPLRADNVARLVKMALSYWISAPKPAAQARRS